MVIFLTMDAFSGFIFGYIHTCRNESRASTASAGEEDTAIFVVSSSFTLANEGRKATASANTGGIQLYKAYRGLKRSGVDKNQRVMSSLSFFFVYTLSFGRQRGGE